MESGINIIIERPHFKRSVAIYIIEKRGNNIIESHFAEEDGTSILKIDKTVGEAEIGSPSFIISSHIYNLLAQAILKDMESQGLKLESDYKIEGTLKAQALHLEDKREEVKGFHSITNRLLDILESKNQSI